MMEIIGSLMGSFHVCRFAIRRGSYLVWRQPWEIRALGILVLTRSYGSSCVPIRGQIVSQWQLASGTLHLQVFIPVNTTATIYVPTSDSGSVTEGGKPANGAA